MKVCYRPSGAEGVTFHFSKNQSVTFHQPVTHSFHSAQNGQKDQNPKELAHRNPGRLSEGGSNHPRMGLGVDHHLWGSREVWGGGTTQHSPKLTPIFQFWHFWKNSSDSFWGGHGPPPGRCRSRRVFMEGVQGGSFGGCTVFQKFVKAYQSLLVDGNSSHKSGLCIVTSLLVRMSGVNSDWE